MDWLESQEQKKLIKRKQTNTQLCSISVCSNKKLQTETYEEIIRQAIKTGERPPVRDCAETNSDTSK